MLWRVDYEPQVEPELIEQIKAGILTPEDIRALNRWVDEIESHGVEFVQTPFWSDHPLEDPWLGYRAASFSNSGRVIYKIESTIVIVVRVTATHNYER